MKTPLISAFIALSLPLSLFAHDASRPDAHAPIGVMVDHTHKAGEWMFSYRYSHMDMQKNYADDSQISDSQTLAQCTPRLIRSL